jgi:DNA-binding NarL/FixJ family response regulator
MIPISVVLADDHPAYPQGLSLKFKETSDIRSIGEAFNGKELVDLVTVLRPDVVLTDIQMPVMNGIEAAKEIHKKFPHIPIVALSGFTDNFMITQMLNAGASGYLSKSAEPYVIYDAIRAAYKGENYFCETVSPLASAVIRNRNSKEETYQVYGLTDRELNVIRLICNGLTNSQIAGKFCTTLEAVKSYRKSITRKTGAKGTAALMGFALKNGIYRFVEG